jgi:hypothetical protein
MMRSCLTLHEELLACPSSLPRRSDLPLNFHPVATTLAVVNGNLATSIQRDRPNFFEQLPLKGVMAA